MHKTNISIKLHFETVRASKDYKNRVYSVRNSGHQHFLVRKLTIVDDLMLFKLFNITIDIQNKMQSTGSLIKYLNLDEKF